MSFLVGYMGLLFVFHLKFESEVFTQALLCIVGCAGVFASNPIGLLVGDAGTVKLWRDPYGGIHRGIPRVRPAGVPVIAFASGQGWWLHGGGGRALAGLDGSG
jgi:murein DD-endopeptidase MepM/ murein hydrolase activator NlpD